jgi:hypothetical protein
MSKWRPDPSFYPSPKMAMEAPPEKLAFVKNLNGAPRSLFISYPQVGLGRAALNAGFGGIDKLKKQRPSRRPRRR